MSSILNVNTIITTSGNPLISNDLGNHCVNFTQCYMTESATYSAANTGNGTTINDLKLVVSPRNANNILIMEWMMTAEIVQDAVFLIHRDGSLVTTSGEQGYNNVSGNVRYSGICAGWYDNNNDSTPSNYRITYQCIAGTTNSIEFAIAVRSSNSTSRTFYLNRCINLDSGGTTPSTAGRELNTSYGYCLEFTP